MTLSDVDVDGGALGGSGTVGGNVTVNSGGGLAPGNSASTLNISGALDIEASAADNANQFNFELDTTGASDQVAVTE